MLGFLITFEGIEGAGKSTQAKRLFKAISEDNFPCLLTSEPGGTPLGDAIRNIFISNDYKDMTPIAELLLINASRAQHVEKVIRPSLEEGKIIICDRFIDASTAYQGYGRELPLSLVSDLNSCSAWNVHPDLTFFLDVEPALGLSRVYERIQKRETPSDRIERESLAFFHRVREGYHLIAQDEPVRFKVLDGGLDPDTIHNIIMDVTMKALKKRKFKKNLLFESNPQQ